MLAEDLGFPFVELSREIEKFAGCSISEIQALYGQNAYRRYERRALEEAIQIYPEAVIATPGGIVSDPATFNLLLPHCTTVWLQADPEDHMKRVLAQGDTAPDGGQPRGDGRPEVASSPAAPPSIRRPSSSSTPARRSCSRPSSPCAHWSRQALELSGVKRTCMKVHVWLDCPEVHALCCSSLR